MHFFWSLKSIGSLGLLFLNIVSLPADAVGNPFLTLSEALLSLMSFAFGRTTLLHCPNFHMLQDAYLSSPVVLPAQKGCFLLLAWHPAVIILYVLETLHSAKACFSESKLSIENIVLTIKSIQTTLHLLNLMLLLRFVKIIISNMLIGYIFRLVC